MRDLLCGEKVPGCQSRETDSEIWDDETKMRDNETKMRGSRLQLDLGRGRDEGGLDSLFDSYLLQDIYIVRG